MKRSKPVVGICGGIGAGKSQVAECFAELGCLVIDSDRLNHEILLRPEVQAQLVAWWGPDVVPAGRPDRRRLAEIVFADPAQKRRLESLTYPLIGQLRETMILNGLQNPAVKAIILDSPLLFESNLDRQCDDIVYVEASEPRRLARLQQSRTWDEHELRQRERWQLPLEQKRAKSRFVVNNDGPPTALLPQVRSILESILARHG